jgi:hypothetical protein
MINHTIRIYDGATLIGETFRGAGAALDHGAAILAHGGAPRFMAYDGTAERHLTMTADSADHDRRKCRVCRTAH